MILFYDLPKILQGDILNVDGDPVSEGDYMFEKGDLFVYILLFVFYWWYISVYGRVTGNERYQPTLQ